MTPKFKIGDSALVKLEEDEGGQTVPGVVKQVWVRSDWGQTWVEYYVDLEGPYEWGVFMEEQLSAR